MKKLLPSVLVFWGLLAAGLGYAPPAAGQPALERLEERIRRRLQQDSRPSGPADRQAKPDAPAGASEGARATIPAQGAGYLGAVADDRKDRGRGARVVDVRPGGPADKGGLRREDLIVDVAGQRVRQLSDLASVLEVFPPGETITLEVLRDGSLHKIRVTLGRRPPSEGPLGAPEEIPAPAVEKTLKPEPAVGVPKPPAPGVVPAIVNKLPQDGDSPQLSPPPTAPPLDPAVEIEQLRRRVEQLERRIEVLERAAEKKGTP